MIRVDWTALIKRERAASALNYGLVVGLVAVLSIGAVQSVGDSVTELFGGVATDLGSAGAGGTSPGNDDTPPPPANRAPTLSAPADVAITRNGTTGALAVTVNDPDEPAEDLILSARSDNQALVADGNIVIGGSGGDRTVTVGWTGGQIGAATITLTVDDATGTGNATATASFRVEVTDRCHSITAADAGANKGTQCTDQTFYIGHHDYGDGEGAVPVFAAACDVGRVFDPGTGGCTGVWDVMPWNDGTSNWQDVDSDGDGETTDSDDNYADEASAGTDFRGRQKTDQLIVEDSSSAGGNQPHLAAQGCDTYNAEGYSDWYMPSTGELNLIWAATHPLAGVDDDGPAWLASPLPQSSGTAFAQTFVSGSNGIFSRGDCPQVFDSAIVDQGGYPCAFWAATESTNRRASVRLFADGNLSFGSKNQAFAVRCVRR